MPGRVARFRRGWVKPAPRRKLRAVLDAGVSEAGSTAVVTANAATVTTASFTPTANSLVVAMAAYGNGAAAATSPGTVTDSVGSTWTRLAGENSANGGEAEVWCCDAGSSPTARTVTWDPGGTGTSGLLLAVRWYSGAGLTASQPGATAVNGGTSTPSKAITTTTTGSLVVGTFATSFDTYTLTANASTTLIGQFNGVSGDTAAAYRATSTTGTPGSVTLGFTTTTTGAVDRMALAEILPAAAGGTAFTRTVDDSAGLTDTAAVASAFVRTVDDSAGLADATAVASTYAREQTDSLGLTDTVVPVSAFARAATDDAGLLDSVATASAFGRSQTDPTGLTDSVTLAAQYVRSVTDDAGVTDAATVQMSSGFARTVDDPAGLTDALAIDRAASVTDGAGLTDSLALVRTATAIDTVGLTDSVSVQLAGAGARLVDDSVGLTDTLGVASAQTLADSLGLADAVTLAVAAARAATDVLGITDSVSVSIARAAVVADTTGLTDSLSVSLTTGGSQVRTITDSIGLDSTIQVVQTTHRSAAGITPRPAGGTTARASAGITLRYPLIPD